MKKLLLFLLFTSVTLTAQINVGPLSPISVCDDNNDGNSTFDLSVVDAEALNGLSAAQFTVTYHETFDMAMEGTDAVDNIYLNISSSSQWIFVRVTENADTSNYGVGEVELIVLPLPPISTPSPQIGCGINLDLPSEFNLTYASAEIMDGCLGCTIEYFESEAMAEEGISIEEPYVYYAFSGTVIAIVTSPSGCTASTILELEAYATGTPSIMTDGQTITIQMNGNSEYEYLIDEAEFQESNTFENVSYGEHLAVVSDLICGTVYAINIIVTPEPPTGTGAQGFAEGETLADLEIDGENILWYDNSGEPTGPPNGMDGDEPLPITTLLTDGTTYYASQTIDGTESAERLAVTAHLGLGTVNAAFSKLRWYPNPVGDVLNIENDTIIDAISIFNMLGQEVMTSEPGDTDIEITLGHLENGVYVLQLQSGNNIQSIRIMKQ